MSLGYVQKNQREGIRIVLQLWHCFKPSRYFFLLQTLPRTPCVSLGKSSNLSQQKNNPSFLVFFFLSGLLALQGLMARKWLFLDTHAKLTWQSPKFRCCTTNTNNGPPIHVILDRPRLSSRKEGTCLPRMDYLWLLKQIWENEWIFCLVFCPFFAFKEWRGMTRRFSGQISETNTQQMTFPQCLISTCQLQECHHNWMERFKARLFIREQTIILET